MSQQDSLTPRVFLARHGETAWAKAGRYTGVTDIDLTPDGVAQVSSAAATLVGASKLVDPSRLVHVFVSPRTRAVKTLEILLSADASSGAERPSYSVTVTEDLAEWNYGDYEGHYADEIRALRSKRGLDVARAWDIWTDGCEGGESSEEITTRLDRLIAQIRAIQRPCMDGTAPATPATATTPATPADVLLVAHGHILRCFVKRWLGFALDFPLQMMLAPGAIAVVSYKNNNIHEPAFHVGLALPHN